MINKKDFDIIIACLAITLNAYVKENNYREITAIDIIHQIKSFSYEEMKMIKKELEEKLFNGNQDNN